MNLARPRAALLATLLCATTAALAQSAAPSAPRAGATPPAAAAAPLDRAHETARIRGERGLDVCRKSADGRYQYHGITEGYEQGKVQIAVRVLDAATGEPVPGIRETNVWDDPANWSVCAP